MLGVGVVSYGFLLAVHSAFTGMAYQPIWTHDDFLTGLTYIPSMLLGEGWVDHFYLCSIHIYCASSGVDCRHMCEHDSHWDDLGQEALKSVSLFQSRMNYTLICQSLKLKKGEHTSNSLAASYQMPKKKNKTTNKKKEHNNIKTRTPPTTTTTSSTMRL